MTAQARADNALVLCRESIATHSKSFALASKLLPAECRDDAAVVYAWCRRADDAIDDTPKPYQAEQLVRLRAELDAVYRHKPLGDPVVEAFADVVRRRRIPRVYPAELLAGMEMDTADQTYPDMATLHLYCYRVASTVGLMMTHVMGISREAALTRAAHLGIAMQLTNICRDVIEDWERGRLYLPDELLARHGAGALRRQLGGPFPDAAAPAVARTVRDLLGTADTFYRSGDAGLPALPWRAAFGVRTARLVYAAIGSEIARAKYDVRAGRAVVPHWRKLLLASRAGAVAIAELPARWWRLLRRSTRRVGYQPPTRIIELNHDLICH